MDTEFIKQLANDINNACAAAVESSAKQWRSKLIYEQKEREKMRLGWQQANQRIEDLKGAIRNIPTDEFSKALRDGCDANGAWHCFLERLDEWRKEVLEF